MRKVLIHLDPDPLPSAFDRIVAYDAGADEVLSYGGVKEADVTGLVHGAIFTRGPKDLNNTALFIGGSSVAASEALLRAAKKTFFGPFRVSAMFDANGSNTTAAAAVVKLSRAVGELRGRRVAALAATGPVGSRAAGLLVRLGATVRISTLDPDLGRDVARSIGERFHGSVESVTVRGPSDTKDMISWAEVLLACGPAGVTVAPRELWAGSKGLKAVADMNAVPPLGVEGVEVTDDGNLREGVPVFGALAVGGLKMKAHKASLARLFERNDSVLDAEEIYDIAAAL